jgi:hypothetical protein
MEMSPLQVKGCKFWPMLGAQGIWAGMDLYRATRTVTRYLGLSVGVGIENLKTTCVTPPPQIRNKIALLIHWTPRIRQYRHLCFCVINRLNWVSNQICLHVKLELFIQYLFESLFWPVNACTTIKLVKHVYLAKIQNPGDHFILLLTLNIPSHVPIKIWVITSLFRNSK